MEYEKRAKPIVEEGKAKLKKKAGGKFAALFLSEDAGHTLEYVTEDVLVPKGKDLLASILKAVIENIIYGRGGYSGGGSTRSSSFSYGAYYEEKSKPKAYSGSKSSDPIFDEIVWPTKQEAEDACKAIEELIENYNEARVGDLYDIASLKVPYTAQKWGWTDFKTAIVVKSGDGFVIKTPKPMPIEVR